MQRLRGSVTSTLPLIKVLIQQRQSSRIPNIIMPPYDGWNSMKGMPTLPQKEIATALDRSPGHNVWIEVEVSITATRYFSISGISVVPTY